MRISTALLLLSCLWLLGACASTEGTRHYGPRGFWRPNRFDKYGKETGRWRTYYDDAKHQPFTTGHYRHGRPVRTFRYYTPTGSLDHSEQYGREGLCEVTHWYAAGQVARRGHAQWVTGRGKMPRFYWFGPWTSYDEQGHVTGIQTYVDGVITRAEVYSAGQLTKVSSYQNNKLKAIEYYENGKLLNTEAYENNIKVGTSQTP